MARILVIDDDDRLREVIRRILVGAGHSVSEAADGREGLAAYDAERPDLVLCDIIMPEREGLETIQALRRRDPPPVVIAMSGGGWAAATDYLTLAREFGARATLEKPFGRDELLAAVTEQTAQA